MRIIIVFLIFISSCKTTSNLSNSIDGHFYKKGTDFEYSLILKKDSTFFLSKKYNLHGKSECSGNWEVKEKDQLILMCSELKDPSQALLSSYMNQREHILELINHRKVKLENIVLTKK